MNTEDVKSHYPPALEGLARYCSAGDVYACAAPAAQCSLQRETKNAPATIAGALM